MPQPNYGAREGLSDRLVEWADRLGKDKTLPWVGLGIIADLKTAADVLDGKPEKIDPEPEAWEIEATQAMEFDL